MTLDNDSNSSLMFRNNINALSKSRSNLTERHQETKRIEEIKEEQNNRPKLEKLTDASIKKFLIIDTLQDKMSKKEYTATTRASKDD